MTTSAPDVPHQRDVIQPSGAGHINFRLAPLKRLTLLVYPIGGTLAVMRPLRYSINVTLDGCCDHREMIADEDLHRSAAENLGQADALLLGRVTYEMRCV